MNIVVFNGTSVKGCTHQIKNIFLSEFKDNSNITEFYFPESMPNFCTGCKQCFLKSESLCPHSKFVEPIWQAVKYADLLVFAYPVYVLGVPAQLKALLDHLGCHWLIHRPKEFMFNKRAVILTNSIGSTNKPAQKDVSSCLKWLGVSSIHTLDIKLITGIIWNQLPDKKRKNITNKVLKLAKKPCLRKKGRKSAETILRFELCRFIHKMIEKNEPAPSADTLYWQKKGWI